MSFSPQITAQTINSASHLQITDVAIYGSNLGSLDKSVFTGRTVVLVRYDGITQSVSFPYTNTNNTLQDTLVVTNYFNGLQGSQTNVDMIVSITINYLYNVNSIPTSVPYSVVYQSKTNCLNSLANLAIATYLGNGDTEVYNGTFENSDDNSNTIRDIINNIEASKAKILVGDLITAQKLLLYAYNICPPPATCEC